MEEHILVTIGKRRFDYLEEAPVDFVVDTLANQLLNDLVVYPHAFVLACMMDRQMQAEKVWMIPKRIEEDMGTFDINILASKSVGYYEELFKRLSLHRFPVAMANVFHKAVQHIMDEYNGDASLIWSDKPSSAAVVYRFLQFYGCGIKIATMAANILARAFKVPFSDYYSIDISPDVHIKRVLARTGLVKEGADIQSIIYKARELYPEFPGIIDYSCWEIGKTYCKPHNPNCKECPICSTCPKLIQRGS